MTDLARIRNFSIIAHPETNPGRSADPDHRRPHRASDVAVFCNLRYYADMKNRHTGDSAAPISVDDAARAGEDSDLVKRLAEKIMDDDREILRALAGEQVAPAREVMSRRRRALRELAK